MDILESSLEMTMDHIFRSGIVPAMKSTIKAYEDGNLSLNEALRQIKLDLDAVDKYFKEPQENIEEKHNINIMIREPEENIECIPIVSHDPFDSKNTYRLDDGSFATLLDAKIERNNLP